MIKTLPDGSTIEIVTHLDGNRKVIVKQPGIRSAVPPAPVPQIGSVAWYIHYTAVHPDTVAGAPKDAIWVDVSGSDIAYYLSMKEIWEKGETFAVLEHDCVGRPDIIQAFEDCPEPWCCFGYHDICHEECMNAWRNMLGCTRFRKELIEAVPDAMEFPEAGWDWHNMCDGLGRNLRDVDDLGNRLRGTGFTHHWHRPPVIHHHLTDGVHGPQSLWWDETAQK